MMIGLFFIVIFKDNTSIANVLKRLWWVKSTEKKRIYQKKTSYKHKSSTI